MILLIFTIKLLFANHLKNRGVGRTFIGSGPAAYPGKSTSLQTFYANLALPVNECKSRSTNSCDKSFGTCIDTPKSYTCRCKPGYTGNRKITDHKCTSNCAQTCDKNAYCAVMPNSENLYCQCNEGFVGDGLSCIGQSALEIFLRGAFDISCTDNAVYDLNTRKCVCNSGFVQNKFTRRCEDVDECATGKCGKHNCINTLGTYRCDCQDGYLTGPDDKFCFKPSQSPECGVGWFYDENEEENFTGCWGYDSDKGYCDILNSKCRLFECSPTHMTGFIRADAFHDYDFIKNGTLSRDIKLGYENVNCPENVEYIPNQRGFQFSFELGTCGMKSKSFSDSDGKEYIQFEQKIGLEATESDYGLFMANFFSSTFTFKCNYEADTTTTIDTINFKPKRAVSGGEKFSSWANSFQISYFPNDLLQNPSAQNSFIFGATVYFKAEWLLMFSDTFPVEFFLERCTVESMVTGKRFNILDNGCPAKIVSGEILSENPLQTHAVTVRYLSFSFDNTVIDQSQNLQCKVKFCLREDIVSGKCGNSLDNC